MKLFNNISQVGFGAYRISTDVSEHREALLLALRSGCNLIDTSANYMNGKSEELIGSVLESEPGLQVVVVTKAGYVQNDNLNVLNDLQSKGLALEDVVTIREDFKHSIHPEFLQAQIEQSLRRLKRDALDVFLLHNPEYYFKSDHATKDEYYKRIAKAFNFLEEKVKEGLILQYGISSNTLPVAPDESNATDLVKVIEIAKSISADHHFSVIEFPYNLAERGAAMRYGGQPSLIEIAKANHIVTLGNRPLNASLGGKPVRLAVFEQDWSALDGDNDARIFDDFISELSHYLKEQDNDINLYDIEIVSHLSKNWMNIGNPEAAEKLFHYHLLPVVNVVYADDVPADVYASFTKVFERAKVYAKRNMALTSKAAAAPLFKDIRQENNSSMAATAIQQYLAEGIDHVLVGMRKVEYVKDLKDFLLPRFEPSRQKVY
jgi:aryl-alcohol dehydrogenase-like predicted oxidoreductase